MSRSADPSIPRRELLYRGVFEAWLAGTILFVTATYGGVEAWAQAVFVCFVVGLACIGLVGEFLSPAPGRSGWTWQYLPLVGLVGWGLLQLLPLPRGLVEVLDRESAALWEHLGFALQSPSDPLPSRIPLSLYPAAGWSAWSNLVAYVALILLVGRHVRDLAGVRRVFGIVVAIGTALAVLTLLRGWGLTADPFSVWTAPGSDRAVLGPLVNRNEFALWVNMIMGFAVGLAWLHLEHLRRRKPRLTWPSLLSHHRTAVAALLIGAVVVLAATSVLALSVMGTVALFAAVLCCIVLQIVRRGPSRPGGVALGTMVIAVGAITYFGWQPVAEELAALNLPWGKFKQHEQRYLTLWADVAAAAAKHPLTGSGAGTFAWVFPRYRRFPGAEMFVDAHNEYLQLAMESGLVGVALAGTVGAAALVMLLRLQRSGQHYGIRALGGGLLLAALAGSLHLATTGGLHVPAIAVLFCLVVGLGVNLSRLSTEAAAWQKRSARSLGGNGSAHRPTPAPARTPTPPGVLCWGAGIAVVTIPAAAVAVTHARVDAHFQTAKRLARPYVSKGKPLPAERFERAVAELERARQASPRDAEVLYGLAALRWYQAVGVEAGKADTVLPRGLDRPSVRRIRRTLQQARRCGPTFSPSLLLLAQIDGLLGRGSAEAFARMALAAAPFDVDGWYVGGNVAWSAGNRRVACRRYRRCLELGDTYRRAIVGRVLAEREYRRLLPAVLPDEVADLLFAAESLGGRDPELAAKLVGRVEQLIENGPSAGADGSASASVLASLAHFYRRRGDLDNSVRYLGEAVRRDSANVTLRTEYARLLFDLGRRREAERQLSLGLRFRPRDAAARQLLGRVVRARLVETQR